MTRSFPRLVATLALVAVAVATYAVPAQAAPLRYTWKKGASYRFKVVSTQDINMAAMGLNMKAQYRTDSVFALHIDRVDGNGLASGVLAVERFTVTSSDGRTLADISALPKRALTNLVDIAPDGQFTFKELVYLLVPQSGATVLARGSVGPDGVNAAGSVNDGNTQVTVFAEFDPKTGRIAAGYNVKKLKPKTKKMAHLQAASRVDVVPFQLLSLLRLPPGDVVVGTTATVKAAGYQIDLKALSSDAKRVQLETTILTPGGPGTSATIKSPQGGADVQMPNMGMGMGMDMGMPTGTGVPGTGGPTGQASQMMKLDGRFVMDFNRARGRLQGITGTLNSAMKAPMVAVTTRTQCALTPLK